MKMYRLLKNGTGVSQIVIIKKAYGLLQILALARQKDKMTATQGAMAKSGLLKDHRQLLHPCRAGSSRIFVTLKYY